MQDALKALVKEKLIHIKRVEGRKVVSPVSILHQSAMEQMVHTWPIKRSLDILEKKTEINSTTEEVKRIEEELVRLNEAERRGLDLYMRRNTLNKRLVDLNKILDKKTNELKALEDIPVEK